FLFQRQNRPGRAAPASFGGYVCDGGRVRLFRGGRLSRGSVHPTAQSVLSVVICRHQPGGGKRPCSPRGDDGSDQQRASRGLAARLSIPAERIPRPAFSNQSAMVRGPDRSLQVRRLLEAERIQL